MSHIEQLWQEFNEAITDGVLTEDAMLQLFADGEVILEYGIHNTRRFRTHTACVEWLIKSRTQAAEKKTAFGTIIIGDISIPLVPPSHWPAPIPS